MYIEISSLIWLVDSEGCQPHKMPEQFVAVWLNVGLRELSVENYLFSERNWAVRPLPDESLTNTVSLVVSLAYHCKSDLGVLIFTAVFLDIKLLDAGNAHRYEVLCP